jgi:hypothetical protein
MDEIDDVRVLVSSEPAAAAAAEDVKPVNVVTEHQQHRDRQRLRPIAAMIPVELENDTRIMPSNQRTQPHVADSPTVQVVTGPAIAPQPSSTSYQFPSSTSFLPPVPIAHSLVLSTADNTKSSKQRVD